MLVVATIFAMVVAIACYALQLILRREIDPLASHAKVEICDTCHRVKRRNGESKCECGGTFEDLDKWIWTDD